MEDLRREVEKIRSRLEKLESQMDFLMRNLGISDGEAPVGKASPRVLELARSGDTVGAIRAFREETGASLKDAKNFVESLPV